MCVCVCLCVRRSACVYKIVDYSYIIEYLKFNKYY